MKLLNKGGGEGLRSLLNIKNHRSFLSLPSLALCHALGVWPACFHYLEIPVLLFSVFLNMHSQKTAALHPCSWCSTPLLTWHLLSLAAAWIPQASAVERAPSWDAVGVQHGSSRELLCSFFIMGCHHRHERRGAKSSLPGTLLTK